MERKFRLHVLRERQIRKCDVVRVWWISKRCNKTCDAPAELFVHSSNSLLGLSLLWIRDLGWAGWKFSMLTGPAWKTSQQQEGNTLLTHTTSVNIMASGWSAFSTPDFTGFRSTTRKLSQLGWCKQALKLGNTCGIMDRWTVFHLLLSTIRCKFGKLKNENQKLCCSSL